MEREHGTQLSRGKIVLAWVRAKWQHPEVRIAIIAVVIRLVLFAVLVSFDPLIPAPKGDARDYFVNAQNLLHHGVLSSSHEAPLLRESFRTPGYPLLIAGVLGVVRIEFAIVLLQAMIAAMIAVCGYRLTRKFFGRERGARVVGYLLALEPVGVYVSILTLTETVFTATLVLALYLLAMYPIRWWRSAIIGALIGYATLTRPIAQFLPPVWIILLILLARIDNIPWRRVVIACVMLSVGFGGIVTPWLMRNSRIYGRVAISSVSEYNLAFYNASQFYMDREGGSLAEARAHFADALVADPKAFGTLSFRSLANSASYSARAKEYIGAHFGAYLAFHFSSMIPFFVSDGVRDIVRIYDTSRTDKRLPNFSVMLRHGQWRGIGAALVHNAMDTTLLVLGVLFWMMVCVAALVGAVRAWRIGDARTRWFVVVCVGAIAYFSVVTGPVSTARYRLPVELFFFALAAVCWPKRTD